MKTVALFFGGRSVEHDVSIVSAGIIARGFNQLADLYRLVPVYITAAGNWVVFSQFPSLAEIKKAKTALSNASLIIAPASGQLLLRRSFFGRRLAADIALPLIHGTYGEDGTLQGLFDIIGVPYTGPSVLGSAIGMDKIVFKDLLAANQLPQVEHLWFHRDDWARDHDAVLKRIKDRFSYPVFVKPANLGSSIGIARAENETSLINAIEVAIRYAARIIIERGVVNLQEINCAVIGYREPLASELEEPLHYSEFLTFADKYIGGGKGGSMKGLKSKVKIPAPVSPAVKKEVQDLAIRVFKLLDCAGPARVDFLLENETRVLINEINTIPGSWQQHLWQHSGLSLPELIKRALTDALAVAADKKRNLTTYDSYLLK